MITVLNVRKKNELGFRDKLLSFIRPYKITAQTKRTDDICIYELTYLQRRGRIRFDKLYDCCKGKSKVILCSRELNLFNTPFKRFNSQSLKREIMKNYIFSVLKKCDIEQYRLHIYFYDPGAEYPSFVQALLEYSSCITVVTDMPKFYENEAERITAENGANIIVSNNISDLYPCDIIISPDVIRKPLSAAASTLIFTTAYPTVSAAGNIICRYDVTMPDKYSKLRPDGIDDMYFMSALYILCRQTELAKLLPESCGDNSVQYDTDTIVRQIRAKCQIEVV